jgi:hypothetical protein
MGEPAERDALAALRVCARFTVYHRRRRFRRPDRTACRGWQRVASCGGDRRPDAAPPGRIAALRALAFGNAAFALRHVLVSSGGGRSRCACSRERCASSMLSPICPATAACRSCACAAALMRPRGPLSGIRSPLARRANPRVCLVPHAPGYPPALHPHTEGLPRNRRRRASVAVGRAPAHATPPDSASSLPLEASRSMRRR